MTVHKWTTTATPNTQQSGSGPLRSQTAHPKEPPLPSSYSFMFVTMEKCLREDIHIWTQIQIKIIANTTKKVNKNKFK